MYFDPRSFPVGKSIFGLVTPVPPQEVFDIYSDACFELTVGSFFESNRQYRCFASLYGLPSGFSIEPTVPFLLILIFYIMNKLTVNQGLNICGTVAFLLLALLFLGFFLMSRGNVSATSNFTMTLMTISIVMAMIDVVFIILTIRSFMYPNQTVTPTPSFDELFVD